MFWLIASLTSAFSKAGERLIHRKVMLLANCYAYGFAYNLIGSLFYIPLLFLFGLQISSIPAIVWIFILLASAIYVATTTIAFESYKYAEVSLREPIGSVRLIVVYVLSLIFLAEKFTIGRLSGTLLIMFAMILMSFKDGKLNLSDRGIKLTIISSVLSGMVAIIEKYALNYVDPLSLSFILFILPALGCMFLLKGKKNDIKFLYTMKYFVIGSAFLCFVGYTARIWAYSLADVSLVYPIFSLSSIFASILGIWILKERKDIGKKLIGVTIAFIGTILLTI